MRIGQKLLLVICDGLQKERHIMLKVVLADDEKKICQLLQIIVDWKQLGFEIVEIVHNGRDALEAVQRHQPEVIVTDIRMPECSGLELLHRVREEKQDIDVVIISGYRQFEYAHTALQDGAEDYLLKPIKKAELTAVLERIRARRQSRGEIQEKLDKIENIQRSLEISTEKLQTQMMQEIISGKLKQVSLEKLNEDYRCGFCGATRYFVVYKVDFGELFQEKTEEVISRKLLDTVRYMLSHNGYRSCCVCYRNLISCLVDSGEEMQELEHLLYHSIREMLDYGGKLTELHVTVGIARVEGDLLHEAFCRGVQAVRDQLFAGTERVLRYRRPGVLLDAGEFVNSRTASNFSRALTQMSRKMMYDESAALLRELRMGKTPVLSGENLYDILLLLLRQIASCCSNLHADIDISGIFEKYEKMLEMCWSWDRYLKLFRELTNEVMDTIEDQQRKREKKPIQEAKRMIEECFREQITLSDISDALGLSAPYFSALFKTETGMTVSQYITNVRIGEAKRLLLISQDPIPQIACRVGYSDEKYFMRVFKKEVGLTISEYRRLYG